MRLGRFLKILLVGLCLVLVLFALRAWYAFSYPQLGYASQQQKFGEYAAYVLQELSTLFISIIYWFATRTPEAWTAAATVALVIVTGLLGWIAYLQIITTRTQLRAYVFPHSVTLVEGMMLNPPNVSRAGVPGIAFHWKNTGQTPASDVVCWSEIKVIEPTYEETLTIPTMQNIFSTHLGADGIGQKPHWFFRPLTQSEIQDIGSGVKGIYFYGRIQYRDIFNKNRFSNFRLIYILNSFPPPDGATMNVCVRGNDAK